MRGLIISVCFGIALIALIYIGSAPERNKFKRVKSGETQLVCDMIDGKRVIDPELIEATDGNTWFFVNGSASRCVEIGGD